MSVAVWLTNYNNEKHIAQAIEYVLAQSYKDLTLFVFDNHSTDGAPAIIAKYAAKDPRVQVVDVPKGLAGIALMAFAWDYLNSQSAKYSITLGGHDFWAAINHLEALVARAEAEEKVGREVALIYTDTWQVDEAGQTVGRFQNIVQLGGQTAAPFVPQVAISTVDSPQLFGLWAEKVRRRVPIRHQCAGWDHLVVMHAAMHGAILFEMNARLVMRCPPPNDSLRNYGLRHFSAAAREQKDKDFRKQLEWITHCVAESCGNDFHRAMLTVSMFATYICLRGYNLAIFEGGQEAFNQDPRVQHLLNTLVDAGGQIRSLVKPFTP